MVTEEVTKKKLDKGDFGARSFKGDYILPAFFLLDPHSIIYPLPFELLIECPYRVFGVPALYINHTFSIFQ
jgi:hypothetical protein